MTSTNDGDLSQHAATAASLLSGLKETSDWRELISELTDIGCSLGVALDKGDREEIEIYFSFLYGTLSGLCAVELPPDSRRDFLAQLELYVRDTLESWCIEPPEKNGSGDQRI